MTPDLIGPDSLLSAGVLVIGSSDTSLNTSPVVRNTSERPTVPPPVGSRDDQALLGLLLVDESLSEQQADRAGYRHVAGRRTLALLRHSLRHPGDRLAVVHFSEKPQRCLRPTNPHSKLGYHALRRALQPVSAGSGTDIRLALSLAADLVPSNWDGLVALILLSDGQDASTTEQLATSVRRFPDGAVHVISIGSRLPPKWKAVGLGSTTVIPRLARPDEVEWATARVLYQSLGLGWTGPLHPPTNQ